MPDDEDRATTATLTLWKGLDTWNKKYFFDFNDLLSKRFWRPFLNSYILCFWGYMSHAYLDFFKKKTEIKFIFSTETKSTGP